MRKRRWEGKEKREEGRVKGEKEEEGEGKKEEVREKGKRKEGLRK